jgi:hypothetical protein
MQLIEVLKRVWESIVAHLSASRKDDDDSEILAPLGVIAAPTCQREQNQKTPSRNGTRLLLSIQSADNRDNEVSCC